ncbi:hypothetical protein [Capnocytophaga gingivalis]|uniref:DUF2262 domain-containing protein n=1 Tax=Capnocytophaga gingivalis TaxID=1017 RepID=A0ABU5YCI6_9FLAO|nr:hypothetical protein [Capnocytophaga gingivalis]MEB3041674.1 hypothetical protein [Capnocytophaga gingivalis]
MTEVLKRYIDASNAFRKAKEPHQGAIALYDLLYDLQAKTERTKEEERILTDTYSLLEYHLSAYETFLRIADPTNYKEKSKLVVLADKAQTHKDTFCIKDIRKLRAKQKQQPFQISDFKKVEDFKSECEYILSKKKVVIFNKEVEGEYFSFFVNKDTPLESCLHSINKYLGWLSDAKAALINYYNEHCTEYTPQADDNWYDTLEVYRGRMNVWSTGVAAHISAGDIFTPDHLLEIDLEGKEITHIGWDG